MLCNVQIYIKADKFLQKIKFSEANFSSNSKKNTNYFKFDFFRAFKYGIKIPTDSFIYELYSFENHRNNNKHNEACHKEMLRKNFKITKKWWLSIWSTPNHEPLKIVINMPILPKLMIVVEKSNSEWNTITLNYV